MTTCCRTDGLDKPPVDGGRSPARQLLEDDRPYVQRPHGRNRARQVRVAPRQLFGRARVLYQLARLHSLFNSRSTINASNTIADATFLDVPTGWAVRSNGGLFVTHDGEHTWTRVVLGISDDLKHSTFPDAQDGYSMGANVIVSTHNLPWDANSA